MYSNFKRSRYGINSGYFTNKGTYLGEGRAEQRGVTVFYAADRSFLGHSESKGKETGYFNSDRNFVGYSFIESSISYFSQNNYKIIYFSPDRQQVGCSFVSEDKNGEGKMKHQGSIPLFSNIINEKKRKKRALKILKAFALAIPKAINDAIVVQPEGEKPELIPLGTITWVYPKKQINLLKPKSQDWIQDPAWRFKLAKQKKSIKRI